MSLNLHTLTIFPHTTNIQLIGLAHSYISHLPHFSIHSTLKVSHSCHEPRTHHNLPIHLNITQPSDQTHIHIIPIISSFTPPFPSHTHTHTHTHTRTHAHTHTHTHTHTPLSDYLPPSEWFVCISALR